MPSEKATPLKVFISYSHDSPDHADLVLALADRLNSDGVDCSLDQYIDSPPEGWPRWMDKQLRDADFVLIICTATYNRRAMAEEEPGKGLGVRWESTLTYQYLYNAGAINERFIPILLEKANIADIPSPLQGVTHYCLPIDYERLYRRLTGQPLTPKPPIGSITAFPPRPRSQDFFTLTHAAPGEATTKPVDNVAHESSSSSTGDQELSMQKYLGKGHAQLATWLPQTWLKEGPPVCFVEGFSGVGKTWLARDLMQNSGWDAVRVEMSDGGSDQVDNLMLDLATELNEIGLNEMAKAVDNGSSLPLALESVLRKQVLIVIDEFQHVLTDETGRPGKALQGLLERIVNRPRLPGRILLLSNRLVERGRWSESFAIRTLSALEPEAAERLLDRLLREANRSEEVPLERRRDVVNWLACNPRAIRVLVAALERDSLDELIGLSPEAWELRDREVSPDLLQRLERELLERTLNHLNAETNRLLRKLSVHRKSVKKPAIEMLLPTGVDYTSIRDDLINRFLMEQHSGWFTLNPIVKEISLQHLKENRTELRQAHSRAADHYMRHFTAKNIVGSGGQLGGYFVEARYHLVQANREADLSQITARFENHLRASFTLVSPVPKERNELNERIAELSALLETPGAKGLEYYLARLYQARGDSVDLQKALTYAQRATGPKAPAESWVLRIRLEGQLNGPERALEVCRKGIEHIPPEQNLVSLYQSCGELLAQTGRLEEAINLLQEGMKRILAGQDLVSLYVSCGELLAQTGRVEEAINLLQEGMKHIPVDKGLSSLYVSCGELLSQAGRMEEAIGLLREGMRRIPANKNRYKLVEAALLLCTATHDIATLESLLAGTGSNIIDPPVVALGRVLRLQIQREWKLAAETAHQATLKFPTYFALFSQEAFSWLCAGDAKLADEALHRFPIPLKIGKRSSIGWLKAWIALKNGDQQTVRENLSLYLGRTLTGQEEINTDLLLRLWNTPPTLQEGNELAYYYPTLPTSITGLPSDVTRSQYGPPVLHLNVSALPDKGVSISLEAGERNTKQGPA